MRHLDCLLPAISTPLNHLTIHHLNCHCPPSPPPRLPNPLPLDPCCPPSSPLGYLTICHLDPHCPPSHRFHLLLNSDHPSSISPGHHLISPILSNVVNNVLNKFIFILNSGLNPNLNLSNQVQEVWGSGSPILWTEPGSQGSGSAKKGPNLNRTGPWPVYSSATASRTLVASSTICPMTGSFTPFKTPSNTVYE